MMIIKIANYIYLEYIQGSPKVKIEYIHTLHKFGAKACTYYTSQLGIRKFHVTYNGGEKKTSFFANL